MQVHRRQKEFVMRAFVSLILAAALASVSGCADMTPKQRNTALGAAAGGVAGAAIWGGPGATLGGAALGGVVGNAVTK
jgi:osmotically inducible lipoprotein OsmB